MQNVATMPDSTNTDWGSLAWEPRWIAAVSVPFDPIYSKNRLWRPRAGITGYFITADVKRDSMALGLLIKQIIREKSFEVPNRTKVWLDILVTMPNHRSDAINFLDWTADAVEGGIGVDDRWFAIWRLDWAVLSKKERNEGREPEIRVRMGI